MKICARNLNSGQVLKNQKLIKWLIQGNEFPVKKMSGTLRGRSGSQIPISCGGS